jgi:multisubunit Na+/H+ antiporter MnhB subunit
MTNKPTLPDLDDDVEMTVGRSLVLFLILALSTALAFVALNTPLEQDRLAAVAIPNLELSGVANPVTAVLLNFRGYDTLLEVAVLFLTIVGIWSMARHARVWVKPSDDDPVLLIFARLFLPLAVIIAAYLFWLGADLPGGAFQGGAILGGMGVLWVAAAIWLPTKWRPEQLQSWLRLLLSVGLLAFTAVALFTLLLGDSLLQYPLEWAKTLIIIIESAAVLSIGATLTLLFIGGFPKQKKTD